jgi:hypothetical protein
MTALDLDSAASGRSKWYGFAEIGDTFKGRYLSATERQMTDYVSGALKTWDDGQPMTEFVIEFQTDLRDDSSDDGKRTLFAGKSSRLFKSMQEALRAAGLKWADEPTLTIKRVEDGDPVTLKNGKKGNAPKCFKAKAERSAPKPAVDLDDDFA